MDSCASSIDSLVSADTAVENSMTVHVANMIGLARCTIIIVVAGE